MTKLWLAGIIGHLTITRIILSLVNTHFELCPVNYDENYSFIIQFHEKKALRKYQIDNARCILYTKSNAYTCPWIVE